MTKEETIERIKVMQAYADGKDIEAWDEVKQIWELVIEPSWADFGKYRIKPEPTYRPFENAQECLEEMKRHEPFGWIKNKPDAGNGCSAITEISCSYGAYFIKLGEDWLCSDVVFQNNTFFDGTPFGVKVEDKEK